MKISACKCMQEVILVVGNTLHYISSRIIATVSYFLCDMYIWIIYYTGLKMFVPIPYK